jgi:hypothetical protein
MDLKTWIIGCLSSGLEQGSKLAMVILGAFTIGSHLDISTLAISISVGFLYGVARWVFFDPITKVTPQPQARFLTFLNK